VRIDHLIFATPDLDATVDALEGRFGVRADPGGKHLGVGTHNALVGLGDATYLEIIAPDPDQPAPSTARPFGLDTVPQPRFAGWAVACGDINVAIARSRRQGYDPGDAIDMERMSPAGTLLRWRLTLNALSGGPVPFLIDWGDCDHPSLGAPQGLRLERFEIEHPDPDELAAALDALDALDSRIQITHSDAVTLVAQLHSRTGPEELR
jgi:catechol 2,3-dioxygenase-like lactoylglutathione lyase family enzyme